MSTMKAAIVFFLAKLALASFLIMMMFINASNHDWIYIWVDAMGALNSVTWAIFGVLKAWKE